MLVGAGWLTGDAIVAARLRGDIVIEPFALAAVNPNSYNYTLGSRVLRLASTELDMKTSEEFEELVIPDEGLVLEPGECYLAHTAEVFGSPVYAALITGRSSVGRKFVTNHVTAGLIDVGFRGQITLEVVSQRRLRIYAGLSFGQIYWFTTAGDLSRQYQGKYVAQCGPVASRLHHDSSETPPVDALQERARSRRPGAWTHRRLLPPV